MLSRELLTRYQIRLAGYTPRHWYALWDAGMLTPTEWRRVCEELLYSTPQLANNPFIPAHCDAGHDYALAATNAPLVCPVCEPEAVRTINTNGTLVFVPGKAVRGG